MRLDPRRMMMLARLAPLLLPFIILFVGGLLSTAAQSVGALSVVPVPLGLDAYRTLLNDPGFRESFGFTFYVAAVSSVIAVVFGLVVAFAVWKLPPGLRTGAVIYKIPLILPHVAVAFIVAVLFSQSGVVASFAARLGLIGEANEFPRLLFGSNGFGLIVAYVYKETPFVALMTIALLDRFDTRLTTTATMLGASRVRTFRRVVLPTIAPAIHTTFPMLFLYAFGGFDIPFVLGASRPQMVSIYVYDRYFELTLADRPVAMAALVMVFAFSGVFLTVYHRATRRRVTL